MSTHKEIVVRDIFAHQGKNVRFEKTVCIFAYGLFKQPMVRLELMTPSLRVKCSTD